MTLIGFIPKFPGNFSTDSMEYSEFVVHCLPYVLSLLCQMTREEIARGIILPPLFLSPR